jgi:hypothetical protein
MRGEQVHFVQQVLSDLRLYEGEIDGIFGHKTYDAVLAFQDANGLEADGIVGPKTMASLHVMHETLHPSNATVPDDDLDLGDAIALVAQGEVGTKETPVGSNIQKYGAWFGWNGVAWCSIFVSWVVHRASKGTRWLCDWLSPSEFKAHTVRSVFKGKGGASVPSVMRACAAAGVIFYAKDCLADLNLGPKPGDLVFFELDKDPDPDHIALVTDLSVKTDGSVIVTTVEGNAPHSVERRTYRLGDKRLLAFGRPAATISFKG